MINGPTIDYDALAQDAMRGVVRTILSAVAKDGLPGDHHFYVSFDTQAPGVSVSRRLREKHPEEMTIVLQHRFWDLITSEDRFEVKLTFDGIPEKLVIPFKALRVFYDPSVRYALQFEDHATGPEGAPNSETSDEAARALIVSMQGETGRTAGRPPGRTAKPRAARRPRIEKSAEGATSGSAGGTKPATTTPATPQPSASKETGAPQEKRTPPAPHDASTVNPGPAEDAAAKGSDKEPGGATIVRLDSFRKK